MSDKHVEQLEPPLHVDDRNPRDGHRCQGPRYARSHSSRAGARDEPRAGGGVRRGSESPSKRRSKRRRCFTIRANPAVPGCILNKTREADGDGVREDEAPRKRRCRHLYLRSIFLPRTAPIVRHHHENWDGTGYPKRASRDRHPDRSSCLSVVDCFDALTSDRPYRPRMTDQEALRSRSDADPYDPLVVDTFTKVHAIPAAGASSSRPPVTC